MDSDVKWKCLESDCHYSTIYKKYAHWAKMNIFKLAHKKVISRLDEIYFKNIKIKELYIDSTDVLNKAGYESVDYTFKYKNKKASRISLISEKSLDVPLTAIITAASVNDSTLTQEMVKSLPIKIQNGKRKKTYLLADSGYINEAVKNKLKQKIELIYPYRSNQKLKNTKEDKERLKGRYKIENVNSWMKNCKRLTMRVDRIDATFRGFVYIKMLQITMRKLKQKNIIL